MLVRLHIENYVLIDSLDIAFPGGLSIITGRTGAGKSILLGALSLALGGKAGPEMIGANGAGCVVEAGFSLPADSPLKAFFEENDLEWNGGSFSIRRVLSASGRSRSFIDDLPVTQGVLAELAGSLVDIHSQHQTRLLTDAACQLEMLDGFAGNIPALERSRRVWKRILALRKDLESLRRRREQDEQLRSYNEARYERLAAARLSPGEMEELEAEQKRLANAESIKENLYEAESLLSPPDGGVIQHLKEAEKALARAGKFLPEALQLEERLASSRLEIDDIFATVADLDEKTDVSGDRLREVEERLSELYSLMNLHRVSDIPALIVIRDALAEALSAAESAGEQEAAMQKELMAAEAEYNALAAELSSSRRAAAGPFSASILETLQYLELERATFRAEVSDAEAGPTGKDAVRFLFSADGAREAEVAKAASGGELSRIMLSLKAMMARYAEMPTMIFDEIDTGVSGSTADRMGSVICSMGKDMQVIAITHLPQVAAKGNAHYLVSRKENPSGGSVTEISMIEGEQRLLELARMLSGSSLGKAAVENAAELLRASQS